MDGLVTPQFTVFKAPSFTTTPETGTASNRYSLSLNCNNTNYLPKLNPLQLELPNYPINTVNLSSKIEFEMIENSISVDQSMERPDGNTLLHFLIDNADPEANGRFADYESLFNQYRAYNFTQIFKFNEEDVSDNTHLYTFNIQYSANLKGNGMPENDQYPYYCYILNPGDYIENYTIIRDFPIFNIDLLQNQDLDRYFGFLSEEGAPIYNQFAAEELEAFNYSRGLNDDLILKSDTGDTNYTLLGFIIRRDKFNDDIYTNTLKLVLKTPFNESFIPPEEFKIKCTEIQYMLSSNDSLFNSEIYFDTGNSVPSDDGQYKYICYSIDLGQYPSTSYKGWKLGYDDISILYDEKGICHWRYFTIQKVQKKK